MMHVETLNAGDREYDANQYMLDDGFILLSKGANFVAALRADDVILIEMGGAR